MKPQIKYENGMIIASAGVQVDTDKDGKPALVAQVEVKIDAVEAFNEILKDGMPDWLKNLIGVKSEESNEAPKAE